MVDWLYLDTTGIISGQYILLLVFEISREKHTLSIAEYGFIACFR